MNNNGFYTFAISRIQLRAYETAAYPVAAPVLHNLFAHDATPANTK